VLFCLVEASERYPPNRQVIKGHEPSPLILVIKR